MKYIFTKIVDTFPKNSKRSDRTMKKLHLGKYSKTLINVSMQTTSSISEDAIDRILDSIVDNNKSFETLSTGHNNFSIIQIFPSSEFSEELVKEYLNDIMLIITDVEPVFAEVTEIDVVYGDAYYGEW